MDIGHGHECIRFVYMVFETTSNHTVWIKWSSVTEYQHQIQHINELNESSGHKVNEFI